jgi:hypothetical protein
MGSTGDNVKDVALHPIQEKIHFVDKLGLIYYDTKLMDYERRLYIYNLCIKRWQNDIEDPEKRSAEPLAENIDDNGRIVPKRTRSASPTPDKKTTKKK